MKFPFSNLFRPQDEIEQALRRPPAPPKVDADLHASIMSAVRQARRDEQEPQSAQAFGWWTTAGAGIALAAVCLGLWLHSKAPMSSPTVASSELAQAPGAALDFGAQLPALVLAPYSNEWARVDHDLHTTTQDLLASLP
jgi:hypothetical protein